MLYIEAPANGSVHRIFQAGHIFQPHGLFPSHEGDTVRPQSTFTGELPMGMEPKALVKKMQQTLEFFDRSSRELKEENSNFKPTPEMMSAAQQVAHSAHTVNWFIDGA